MIECLDNHLPQNRLCEVARPAPDKVCSQEELLTAALILSWRQQETRDALLFMNQDTNAVRQNAAEFLGVVASLGFESLATFQTIAGHLFFFAKSTSGALLRVHEGHNFVWVATLFFNFQQLPDAIPQWRHPADSNFDCVTTTQNTHIYTGSIDVRQGLRFWLERYNSAMIPDWLRCPAQLSLTTAEELESIGFGINQLQQNRLKSFPEPWQQKIILT